MWVFFCMSNFFICFLLAQTVISEEIVGTTRTPRGAFHRG